MFVKKKRVKLLRQLSSSNFHMNLRRKNLHNCAAAEGNGFLIQGIVDLLSLTPYMHQPGITQHA